MSNTWQRYPQGRPWIPPPAPRIINRGIQGGTFVLDKPLNAPVGAEVDWLPVLKLQSKCPDNPSAESNDHFRTIYVQCSPGPFDTIGEDFLMLGVVLRFRFGIGNGSMHTIYDCVPNGIIHAAVTGESVEVDAATVQIFFNGDFGTEMTQQSVDNPTPIKAVEAPTITIGVVQNQALAMNPIQNTKRMFNVTTPGMAGPGPRKIPVPAGAQSVTIVGDPNALHAQQIFSPIENFGIDIPINEETPLAAGVWLITADSIPLGADSVAGVIFGLGD